MENGTITFGQRDRSEVRGAETCLQPCQVAGSGLLVLSCVVEQYEQGRTGRRAGQGNQETKTQQQGTREHYNVRATGTPCTDGTGRGPQAELRPAQGPLSSVPRCPSTL